MRQYKNGNGWIIAPTDEDYSKKDRDKIVNHFEKLRQIIVLLSETNRKYDYKNRHRKLYKKVASKA